VALPFSQLDDLPTFRDVGPAAASRSTLAGGAPRARRIVDLPAIRRRAVSVGRLDRRRLERAAVLIDASGLGSTEEVLVARGWPHRDWPLVGRLLDDPEVTNGCRCVDRAREASGCCRQQRPASPTCSRGSRAKPQVQVGITAITQQPKLLDAELLSQFTLLRARSGRRARSQHLRSSAKQTCRHRPAEIQTLMPGSALIVTSKHRFAVPAKVDL